MGVFQILVDAKGCASGLRVGAEASDAESAALVVVVPESSGAAASIAASTTSAPVASAMDVDASVVEIAMLFPPLPHPPDPDTNAATTATPTGERARWDMIP
jgi:hypothetical protein